LSRTNFERAVVAIQAEFVEMPGLRLTVHQVGRLCEIPGDVCQTAVGALVATGFLSEIRDGSYVWRGKPPVRVTPLDPLTWAVAPDA